jgi:large subunit ribosomal protein L5
MARLKEKYTSELAAKLQEKLGVTNKMLVPRLTKVVINMGFGIVEKDVQKGIIDDLTRLSGQKPVLCKARKSISNFKLREGMVIGAKVTLRGERMFEFMDRLINSALPRIRDFRGVPNRGFDGRGNYTLGLKEHTIFPEMVDSGVQGNDVGMDLTFVTSAKDNKGARELLSILGMPFAGK